MASQRLKIKKSRKRIKILDAQCVETPKGKLCTGAFIPTRFKTLKTKEYIPRKKTLKKHKHGRTMKKKPKSSTGKSSLPAKISVKSRQKAKLTRSVSTLKAIRSKTKLPAQTSLKSRQKIESKKAKFHQK